ncbi:MAG: hypothetical protein IJA58_07655 [Lachnospiraceae bacterium]|nr:hypothetical protein [Lachnospiraceae bacterium]
MAVLLHRTRHLMISLMFVFACLLTGCGSHIDPTLSLEDPALEWLISQETANVADAMAAMNSIEASREAQAQASREESKSIEESLLAESISKEAESLSIEQSEYADYLASSAAESSSVEEALLIESIAESIYSGGEPTGILTPGKVSSLKESELPKLRGLFSDTIVVGNSQAYCLIESGLFTPNDVIYRWASTVSEIMGETIQAANLHRGKALFILGTNDLGTYTDNVAGFIRDYTALINAFREINPDAQIFIQEIIPIPDSFAFRWYNRFRVPDYNAALQKMCEETGCTFVKCAIYAMEEFLLDDNSGVHYNRQYHVYWAQAMANQMNLWEDR